jgi:hypothetical protein
MKLAVMCRDHAQFERLVKEGLTLIEVIDKQAISGIRFDGIVILGGHWERYASPSEMEMIVRSRITLDTTTE